MSLVKFERIVSVSSEDPSFPAENLLKSNYNDKKWKCKLPGEKQISVVLQMDSAVTISAIDIGNYGSAFIEVFVGKSSNPDDFKVLIVASSLMTLQEAKLGENISNVRFFKEDSLAKPVSVEKWDRIKLVCSQPYNKFIQYGLSFVVVHSKNITTSQSAVSTLGKFNLKTKDESEDITVGSLFAKRKADPAPELKGAAAIRAASTSGIITQKKPSLMALSKNAASEDEEINKVSSGLSSETNVPPSVNNSSSPVLRKDNKKKQKPDKPRTPKAKPEPRFNGSLPQTSTSALTNGESSSKKPPSKNKEETKKNIVPKKRLEKPFNQLMGGVVFAISGFQNPYRSDLRNKALAMGAKYRPDWDSTCTHLLCAFPNTPKFNQVLGQGKIVTKEWIESCYSRRMRFPWRRFALHPPDKNVPESEEEIIEYVPRPPSPVDNRRRISPGPASSGEDTEEEIERVLKLQNKTKKDESQVDKVSVKDESDERNQKHLKESSKMFNDVDLQPVVKEPNLEHQSPSNKTKVFHKNKHKESNNASPGSKKKNVSMNMLPTNKKHGSQDIHSMDQEEGIIPDVNYDPGPSRTFCETDIYEMDTDVEPENSFSKQYGLMPLLTYYEDIRFLVGQDLTEEERKKVNRYIFAHKGIVVEKPNSAVEFIITRSADEVNKVKNLCPKAVGVKPDWVWICHDCNYLSPISKFKVK
ncbi:unnamed protein product [Nezara viridula]|uniref:BRCT domain-containing protein n=1 Tax=Nezara viridula TaxID=85310 RepID=A0A9P0GVF3_NEZVI|nr:unnamed protein product [Nezara viridula]